MISKVLPKDWQSCVRSSLDLIRWIQPIKLCVFETNAQLTWNKHINHIHSIITWSILRLRPNWGVHTFYLMSHGEIPLMVFKIVQPRGYVKILSFSVDLKSKSFSDLLVEKMLVAPLSRNQTTQNVKMWNSASNRKVFIGENESALMDTVSRSPPPTDDDILAVQNKKTGFVCPLNTLIRGARQQCDQKKIAKCL